VTDRSGSAGNVPLPEHRLASRESVGVCVARRCTGTRQFGQAIRALEPRQLLR
jgi:hypothetical protein